MHTPLARRTAANIRAAFVIVAFTALAAAGFAAGRSIHPTRLATGPMTPGTISAVEAHRPSPYAAPAACPIPASAFRNH